MIPLISLWSMTLIGLVTFLIGFLLGSSPHLLTLWADRFDLSDAASLGMVGALLLFSLLLLQRRFIFRF